VLYTYWLTELPNSFLKTEGYSLYNSKQFAWLVSRDCDALQRGENIIRYRGFSRRPMDSRFVLYQRIKYGRDWKEEEEEAELPDYSQEE